MSAAQDSPPTPAAPRASPQFQVEVLIFTHRDFDPSEEQFALEDRRTPAPEQPLRSLGTLEDGVAFDADAPVSLDAAPPSADGAAPLEPDAARVPENEFTFRVLRPRSFSSRASIACSRACPRTIRWCTAAGCSSACRTATRCPVDLGVLGVANPAGTIRLSLTRFLHVKLDLTYVDTQAVQTGPAAAPGDLTELPIAPRYHLDAERTTRSGELHYFDHPAFGVLIKVTPVKADPNAARRARPAA